MESLNLNENQIKEFKDISKKFGKNQTIVKDEINEVKIRKFSYLKTLRFIGLGLIRTIFR